MLNFNESALEHRRHIDKLVDLVDNGFDERLYDWHQFLNDWEMSFTLDTTRRARLDESWVPSDKQVRYIRSIIGKLEFHIEEIRKHHS